MNSHLASGLGFANLALLTILALGGDGTHAAPATPRVIQAELIELIDARGTVRAQLQTEDDGAVVLRLRDTKGNVRVKLAADELGSGLLLANEKTDVGVHIQSGVSRTTQKPATSITVAGPNGTKSVLGPGGVK
jgi:hypothetical protein